MKYFISDLHFDHKNILKYNAEFRSQWNTIEEMNEGLIKLWNETVSPQDEVYFLGDLTFKMKAQNYINILSRLNGKVHWIFGNHDNRSEKLLNELKQHTKLVKFKGGKSATTSFTVTASKPSAGTVSKPSTPANKSGVAKKAQVHRNVVKTDDSSNVFADIIALLLSGSALAGISAYRRKRA